MSKSNSCENNLLKLLFNNTTWAAVGDATGLVGSAAAGSLYISLCTADPTDTGSQTTNETAYTNYARVAVARTTGGWTASSAGSTSNVAAINFPQCGATGATLTNFGIGSASSGTGELLYTGGLTANLAASNGITPSFAIGALVVTED